MTHTSIKLLLSLLFFISLLTTASAVDFQEGTLEEIQAKAANEGKLYFVSFTAKWCAPCKIMKEYTFPEPNLSEYTKDNYLAATYDTESFDGVAYKMQYNVGPLPTIIVFNSQGEEVGRFEKNMTATELLNGLKIFDLPENRIKKIKYTVPEMPVEIVKQQEKQSSESGQNNKFLEPLPSGFGVQIGVFGSYANAEKQIAKFRMQFVQPLNIFETKLSEKQVYRLVAGEFEQKSQAKDFKGILDFMGIDGMVKDLVALR